MSFSTIAAMSFGGTGWLALALVASEISSGSQPANSRPADSAAEVMSARQSERLINAKPQTQRAISQPHHSVRDLTPLTKILTFGPPCRKPTLAPQKAPSSA